MDRRCKMCALLLSPRRLGCRHACADPAGHMGAGRHPLNKMKCFGKQTNKSFTLISPHRLTFHAFNSVFF